MASSDPPDIFDHDTPSSFLKAWFKHAKDSGRPMSHEVAGRKVGLNRGHVGSFINGHRKMPIGYVDAFAELLNLDPDRTAFLRALVEKDRARTPAGKHEAQAKITGLRKQQARPRADETRRAMFEHWYLPVIAELSRLESFRRDPSWIAGALSPPISPEEASGALETLDSMGLMADELSTGMGNAPAFSRTYHEQVIGHASTSMTRVPYAQREIHSFTTAASPALVAELNHEIQRSVERWMAQCAAAEDSPDRVIQVCVQSFTIAGPIAASENDPT